VPHAEDSHFFLFKGAFGQPSCCDPTMGLASTLRRLVSEFVVLYIACDSHTGSVTGVDMSLMIYICMELYSGMCRIK
jgi:hypothetical protein